MGALLPRGYFHITQQGGSSVYEILIAAENVYGVVSLRIGSPKFISVLFLLIFQFFFLFVFVFS